MTDILEVDFLQRRMELVHAGEVYICWSCISLQDPELKDGEALASSYSRVEKP